ncbi:MAG: dicarboxylate/amino acid:cation symporter [Sphaerochaetaceae bacterium]|nr:dicarboxylate/amino acid:cation symporter [Sphaerochaetaceae bacterium]
MKTWLTYLLAVILGFTANLLFGGSTVFATAVTDVCAVLIHLITVVSIPLVFITLAASVASAFRPGRSEKGAPQVLLMVFWGLASSVLCVLLAIAAFTLFPRAFPWIATAEAVEEATFADISGTLLSLTLDTLSLRTISSTAVLFFSIPVALIAGFAFRPTGNIYVPAYNLLNSLSEVCMRIMKGLSRFWFLPVAFFSGFWAEKMIPQITGNLNFVLVFICFTVLLVFVFLPLLFAFFTRFKVNPYRELFCFLPSLISGFFVTDYILSFVPLYSNLRNNSGIQKRHAAAAIPFNWIFSRGGSAAISTFVSLSLIMAISESADLAIPVSLYFKMGLLCFAASFACCLNPGTEVLVTVTLALTMAGADVGSSVLSIFTVLPLLNGACIMTDVAICGFSASYLAYKKESRCMICANDMV